jgi:phosphoribosylanthranilate isomerase
MEDGKRHPMIVQIYEIQDPKEAVRCIELGVDHVGSVLLSEAEWKQPRIREVIRLSEGSGARNTLIPLFQTQETLYRALDYYRPDYIHFCESLTDARGRPVDLEPALRTQVRVKQRYPHVGIMRSIPVPAAEWNRPFPTLEIAARLEGATDIFLTDTWLGREPVEGYIGITGKTGDPQLSRRLVDQSRIPVILAGGLSPENVFDHLLSSRASGADSCTQTNRLDGEGRPIRFQKDFERVQQFVQEVRRASQASPTAD